MSSLPTRLLLPVALLLVATGCGSIDDYPLVDCAAPGDLGCACKALETCNTTPDGQPLACDDGICRLPSCDDHPGEAGCRCGSGESACAEGNVCVSGRCTVDTGQTLVPPIAPRCYTPCQGPLSTGDGVRACNDEGLMEGCVNGAVCRSGTCVQLESQRVGQGLRVANSRQALEGSSGACSLDSDCPDFQSCIQGQCYSDCETTADCNGDRVCHRFACRLPCTVGATEVCPAQSSCISDDGTTGFCMPVAPPTGGSTPPPQGSFTLSTRALDFSLARPTGSFVLTNAAAESRTFTVRKRRHREFRQDGARSITNNPLHWVTLAVGQGPLESVSELQIEIPAGGSVELRVGGTDNPELPLWDGELEVVNAALGSREVLLTYARAPEGQWSGTMVFLANFPQAGLEAWIQDRSNRDTLRGVGNAFIRRWGALRDRRISLQEFRAALNAMQTESWKWDSVRARCPTEASPDSNVACYLYDNNVGLSVFSDFLPDTPIPTGVTEFPITVNLRKTPGQTDATAWSGRVDSRGTLHYAGFPRVDLAFSGDPSTCETGADGCLNLIRSFGAEMLVGGRYVTDALDTTCRAAAPGTFQHHRVPWLVPGFEEGTKVDSVTGARYRYECRDKTLPFGEGSEALNASLAGSNPIPDGATRRRRLELVDGALINQDTLFVIFRETLPSFLDPHDPEGFSAYGYMLLTRGTASLRPEDYAGAQAVDYRPAPTLGGPTCEASLIRKLQGGSGDGVLRGGNASALGIGVVQGLVPSANAPVVLDDASAEKVHYLCVDTGHFNGSWKKSSSGEVVSEPCPAGSPVVWFTLQGAQGTADALSTHACHAGGAICRAGEPCAVSGACKVGETCDAKGTCAETLETWRTAGTHAIRMEPVWRCEDPDSVLCDDDRSNLRAGKTFYAVETQEAVFRPLDIEIADAFRYKTRFRNRTGDSVGFAPQTCVPGSDAVPYCYDPAAIEAVRERVDCAAHIYTRYYPQLDDEARSVLKDFLVRNYAYSEQFVSGLSAPLVIDGFERLNAELLIMLGDESFTAAFASRFDLAGQQLASFEGERFEPGGISLSGGAGFEMYSLYQATQLYQSTLDRFYRSTPLLWASLGPDELPPGQGFITQATTVSYFDRLIRASSQKTRVWSEIARRYQSFNRPDLARAVIERSYTQAYLEAIVLSQMMNRVGRSAPTEAVAQINRAIELAQHTYRAALLDMRSVYRDITDSVSFYGIAPDYVPFPALDPFDNNAFEKALQRARDLAGTAVAKEERALSDNRQFETDAALFQAELSRIRFDAEDQLSAICGSFGVLENGEQVIYPAIPKYAYLDPRASLMGDPCGLMGNGDLNDAMGRLDQARIAFDQIKLAYVNLLADHADVGARVDAQCGRVNSLADLKASRGGAVIGLQATIGTLTVLIDGMDRAMDIVANMASFGACTVGVATNCPTAAVSGTAYAVSSGVMSGVALALEAVNVGLQGAIMGVELAQDVDEIKTECEALRIDGRFEGQALLRRAAELQLEALRLHYDVKLAISEVSRLRNDASSIMASQLEYEQLAINVEAARNDPNVRIYRNDAIAAADRTFYSALKEAYRATRVFEYYTSQSYAALAKLYVVRMVSHGDFTLEAYLDELESAYVAFQEQYGNPDVRVAVLSLRDDVLRIPRLSDDGTALSEAQRTQLLRQRLADTRLLDARGYLTLPFATSVDALSPLTRNHKLLAMEADIVGERVGDTLGRLYVTQKGTGVVRRVDGQFDYYAFPSRTAVVNTSFNGVRAFTEDVYRSERLRDRPLANTGWELIFNQKDEAVNADIELNSLTDVRLLLYYTDFTEL